MEHSFAAKRGPTYAITLEKLDELQAAPASTELDDQIVLDQAERVLADYVNLSSHSVP